MLEIQLRPITALHIPMHHVIAANEGNAVAIAASYHLATGKIPVVYMQNSGEGKRHQSCCQFAQ